MEKKTAEMMKFDSLSEIVPGRESWRIKVRVLRLWKVPGFINVSETNSIEMVLVDEKGAKMHATIRKQMLYMFDSKIEEGGVYQMSFFSVCPATGYYRTTMHPYKLIFQMKTRVKLSPSAAICDNALTLTNFSDVLAHTHDYEYLVDVIGLMTGMSVEREYIRDGKVTKMVLIELTDHSGKCECALFGNYVDLLKKMMGKSGDGLPVVVVQFAKIKMFRDKISIQNVIDTTRIFVNPNIPEVDVFHNSIALHGIDTDSVVPLIGSRAKAPMDEEFLRMHPKKTLTDLVDMVEDGIFAVYGTVVGIVGGQEWWYPACKCHKSVIPDSGAYYCNGCSKHIFQVIPRFRLKVHVSDGKTTCIFVLFDADMSYMMEKSCAHFVAAAKVEKGGAYPIEFDSLVGQKMLFIVDTGIKTTNVSDGSIRVKRVCLDSTIIEKFCAEGPFSTPLKSIPPVNLDDDDTIEEDSTDESNSLDDSQLSDYVADLIVTPESAVENPYNLNVELTDDVVITGSKDGYNLNIRLADDVFVTGETSGKRAPRTKGVGNAIKRNLSEAFESAEVVKPIKPLKTVKIEKE